MKCHALSVPFTHREKSESTFTLGWGWGSKLRTNGSIVIWDHSLLHFLPNFVS